MKIQQHISGEQEMVAAIQSVAEGKQYFSHSASLFMRKPDKGELPPLTRCKRKIVEKNADELTSQKMPMNCL